MARSGVRFGRKTEDAIAALLSQRNVDEAARTAGIGTRTLLRWMKDPEFAAAFRAGGRETFGQTPARPKQDSRPAFTTLMRVMQDATTPASSRVRAAEIIV